MGWSCPWASCPAAEGSGGGGPCDSPGGVAVHHRGRLLYPLIPMGAVRTSLRKQSLRTPQERAFPGSRLRASPCTPSRPGSGPEAVGHKEIKGNARVTGSVPRGAGRRIVWVRRMAPPGAAPKAFLPGMRPSLCTSVTGHRDGVLPVRSFRGLKELSRVESLHAAGAESPLHC